MVSGGFGQSMLVLVKTAEVSTGTLKTKFRTSCKAKEKDKAAVWG
jgi:hypothetical protein